MKNFDIIVIRINNTGGTANSRPCYNCLAMMKAVGIRKVHYSDSNGNIISETVKNMVSIQASVSSRYINRVNSTKRETNIEYFEKLLKNLLPNIIKRVNFENFIKYNLSTMLPGYTYTFSSTKGITIVSILNPSAQKIIAAQIIN